MINNKLKEGMMNNSNQPLTLSELTLKQQNKRIRNKILKLMKLIIDKEYGKIS